MGLGTLKNKAKSFLEQYEQKDPVSFAAAQQAIGGLLILDGFVGIDNPFEGRKRSGIFGTLIGIVLGIAFMFVPAFFGNVTGANSMTATTNAVIVAMTPQASTSSKGGNACSLTVQYTVAGKEYSQPSSISSSDNCTLTAGQTIPINYNPQNPGAWAYNLKSTGTYLSLFFWAGLLVAITSFITFIIRLLSIIFGWKLLQSGRALAKTLPQGVSLGTLIEEIKQNFRGAIFNRGIASVPSMPFMQPAQTQVQGPVVAPAPATPPSPSETPVQQAPVAPMNTVATPQFAAPNNYSSQPLQTAAPTTPLPSTPPSSYESGTLVDPTPSVSQSQPAPQSGDYPSSTPPTQHPLL